MGMPGYRLELPLRVDVLGAAFKRIMKEAEVAAGYGISSHTIRHWFSTKTYTDADLPMAVGMAVVGHKSVATAMRYTHVSRERGCRSIPHEAAGMAQDAAGLHQDE